MSGSLNSWHALMASMASGSVIHLSMRFVLCDPHWSGFERIGNPVSRSDSGGGSGLLSASLQAIMSRAARRLCTASAASAPSRTGGDLSILALTMYSSPTGWSSMALPYGCGRSIMNIRPSWRSASVCLRDRSSLTSTPKSSLATEEVFIQERADDTALPTITLTQPSAPHQPSSPQKQRVTRSVRSDPRLTALSHPTF